MTPEQWNQFITILLSALGGTFAGVGLLIRYWIIKQNTKLNDWKEEQQATRAKEKAEFDASVKREDRLFELTQEGNENNKAHANSYEIVAHTLRKLTDASLSSTAALEGVETSLGNVEGTMSQLIKSINEIAQKVDEQIAKINQTMTDLLDRDEANVNANTIRGQEIITAIKTLQKEMAILHDLRDKMVNIDSVVSRLDDTRPIPDITDNAPDTEADTGAHNTPDTNTNGDAA